MAVFGTFTPEQTERGRAFLGLDQGAVEVLEAITSAEKALAVPYLKIWRINPQTGEPVHANPDKTPRAPLTIATREPPAFGVSGLERRHPERPDVSLESVRIKTVAPRDIICYHTFEIALVAHRPEALFEDPPPGRDGWISLITPGEVHMIEYGWAAGTGIANPLIGGGDYVNSSVTPPIIVPSRRRLRMQVVASPFSIGTTGEVRMTLSAYEMGEFHLRQAVLGFESLSEDDLRELATRTVEGAPGPAPRMPVDTRGGVGDKIRDAVKNKLKGLQGKVRSVKGSGPCVTFKDLADALLAGPIEATLRAAGYRNVRLWLGNFNELVGTTSPRYGGITPKSIGDFLVPLREVEEQLGLMLKNGHQMTLYNFLVRFLELMGLPDVWARPAKQKDSQTKAPLQRLPRVVIRTVSSEERGEVAVYVFDVNREFVKFTEADRIGRGATKAEVRQKLRDKGIPIFTLGKGLSFIEDSKFDVQQDPHMKAIMIRRYLKKSPYDANEPDIVRQVLRPGGESLSVDARQLIFASSIVGNVQMMGNFATDTFSMIWVEFGIRQFDGTFNVLEREDVIEPGRFVTTIRLQSTGDDPLGTQGRKEAQEQLAKLNPPDPKPKSQRRPSNVVR
jgi:hypothetical protein